VPQERNRFLNKQLFGEAVERNFNLAQKDILEAGGAWRWAGGRPQFPPDARNGDRLAGTRRISE